MFYPSIRQADYRFLASYSRAKHISRKEFLIRSLKWQLQNPDIPIHVNVGKVNTLTITSKGEELEGLLNQLTDMYPELTEAQLSLRAVANYISFNRETAEFNIEEEDIEVPQRLTVTLSPEITGWLAESYGTVSKGVQESIVVAHGMSDLPPIEGSYRNTSTGGKQVGVYLNAPTREKIKDMILIHGGSPNTILKLSIMTAKEAYETF